MRLHELRLASRKQPTRSGRGISAGRGKTAGRGTKGQNSRTGGGVRPGFEGGQNPLTARIPKLPGFTSRRTKPQTVTVGQLSNLSGKTLDTKALSAAGLLKHKHERVKLVAGGVIKSAKAVKLSSASPAAIKQIEAAGGSFEAVEPPKRVSRKETASKP